MIVYIASYPRSGNSLVRDILHHFFQRATANIHGQGGLYPKRLHYAENWRLPDQILLMEKLQRGWLVWNEWMAMYDIPPHTKNIRYLVHGCKPALTRLNRWRMAAEENIFFPENA